MMMESMPGRAAIVYHAHAGRGQAARAAHAAASLLTARGWQVAPPLATRHALQAREELGPFLASRADLIVVAAGDGTLRELGSGLGPAGARIILGLLPLGNANVIARELGIPLELDRALRVLVEGHPQTVDAARLKGGPSGSGGRFFLAMLEIGFGAMVIHRTHALRSGSLKTFYRLWADGVYALAAFHALGRSVQPPFSVSVDGGAPIDGCRGAVLANAGAYARGWTMVPGAGMCDGRLDLIAHRHRSVGGLACFFGAALHGRQKPLSNEICLRGRCWNFRAAAPLSLQVDGDPHPPLKSFAVEVIPQALKIMAPRRGASS